MFGLENGGSGRMFLKGCEMNLTLHFNIHAEDRNILGENNSSTRAVKYVFISRDQDKLPAKMRVRGKFLGF